MRTNSREDSLVDAERATRLRGLTGAGGVVRSIFALDIVSAFRAYTREYSAPLTAEHLLRTILDYIPISLLVKYEFYHIVGIL